MTKNNRIRLTLKYTSFMSVVLVASLIIIYIVSERARHEAFQGTLRSEAITKANLFLENKVDAAMMQHIYLNNTQFINEVEVAVYTPDFKMLYHDAAEHDIVKETPEMIREICERGEMSLPAPKGYQAVGILYNIPPAPRAEREGTTANDEALADEVAFPSAQGARGTKGGGLIVTAAAHDGYGEAHMAALRHTLLCIFLIAVVLMTLVGYLLATLTIRPIERALASQKMFASNVSHELRTPLAAVMGELGLALQRERTPADYQERIGRALNDASRMSDTIIGLLNLARAEYDASQIKMEPIRIDELLMDVAEELLRAKPDYRVNVSFEGAPSTPSEGGLGVVANRYLLALALRNLMDNNCKYSADHTSSVVIHPGEHLLVTFTDRGPGMSTEEQRDLFRPFFRGASTTTAGHGIGMALVERIVRLHDFTIDVSSKVGHGTTFSLRMKVES